MEYVEQIRQSYSSMGTEELINRARSGTLTEEAHLLALKELQSRGIDTTELPGKPTLQSTKKEISPGFFWRCWQGKERLWKAYWLLGLLGGFVLGLTRIPASPLIQIVLFFLVALPIQVFWWVSVWRCAFRSSHWGWAILARGMVILGVVISCLVILRSLA